MGNANVSNVTIRPEEADFFAKLARDWWNPKGPMASLHQVNPVRLAFVRDAIDAHWPGAAGSAKPLEGRSALDIGTFDLVTCVEVIEHVADKPAFLRDVAARLAPDGLLVMSTPNRTAASRVLLVGAAEAVGYVPKGTHHWEDFVTPEEFEALLAEAGLTVTARSGIAWRPGKGLHLAEDMSLNYILSARRA